MQTSINSAMDGFFEKAMKKIGNVDESERSDDKIKEILVRTYEKVRPHILESITSSFPAKTTKSPPKDKNAPKGNKNSFMFFCEKNRDAIKEELRESNTPDKLLFEKTKLMLKERWTGISEEDKEEYKLLAAEDKKRFETEMEEYKTTDEFLAGEKIREAWYSSNPQKKTTTKMPVDETAPKRPQSAYFLFCHDLREIAKNNGRKISTEECGVEWKKLSEKKKNVYKDKFNLGKIDYDILKKEYVPTPEYTEQLREWKEKNAKKKDENAPKRPPSASQIFYTEMKDSIQKSTKKEKKELQEEVKNTWKELEASVKNGTANKKQSKEYNRFIETAKELREKHKEALVEYNSVGSAPKRLDEVESEEDDE